MAELRGGYNLNPEALWVGEIPDGWEFFKGKYVFGERFEKGNEKNLELLSPTQKYGVIPQSMYDELSGMRAVKVKESTDLSAFKTVHIGDFCISLRSFQGGFEYSKYEGVVSPAYHILYSKKNVVDGYYKYLFKEQSFIDEMNSYCQSLRDGKNISYEDFGKTLIPYPPLEEQQAIADYLDDRCSKIDEIIAEVTASIEEYKELKQAVIFEAVTKGLDKTVSMKDSGVREIGEIPMTWYALKLKYVLSISSGDAVRAEELDADGDCPVYGGGEQIGYCKESNCTEENLLIGRVGARCGCVTRLCRPSWATDNALIVTTVVNRDYLYYILDAAKLNDLNTSNAQPLITGTKIKNKVVAFTYNLEEQNRIISFLNKKCADIDALIHEKQALVEDLQAYKKSLIYEVVTGKRRVIS